MPGHMCDRWFEDEVRAGLLGLMTLSLDRTPSAEAFPATVAVWLDSLTREMAWNEDRDLERVRTAFSRLSAQNLRWPAPREFLIALPPPRQPKRIGNNRGRKPSAVALAHIAECARLLAEVEAAEPSPPMVPPLRSALRRPAHSPSHYRDGRAAAAGELLDPDPLDPANWPENQPQAEEPEP